jgi:hypothetical protein
MPQMPAGKKRLEVGFSARLRLPATALQSRAGRRSSIEVPVELLPNERME